MQTAIPRIDLADRPLPPNPDELVRAHLPLVHHVVADMIARVPRHIPRDELTSAALYGLVQAARAYDPSRGVSFDRYARRRMQGALLDDLRGRDWASRGVRAQARRIRSATDDLTVSLGRVPTATEAGAAAGLSAGEVTRLNDDVHRATVLNYDSVFRDSEDCDALSTADADPGDVILGRERRAYLRDAVAALPERLRIVVVGCFFEERAMLDLARELGVTESRVSQMKAEALSLLREGLDATLEAETDDAATAPPAEGRVARRKAAYFAAVAAGSSYRDRLDSDPRPLRSRGPGGVPRERSGALDERITAWRDEVPGGLRSQIGGTQQAISNAQDSAWTAPQQVLQLLRR